MVKPQNVSLFPSKGQELTNIRPVLASRMILLLIFRGDCVNKRSQI